MAFSRLCRRSMANAASAHASASSYRACNQRRKLNPRREARSPSVSPCSRRNCSDRSSDISASSNSCRIVCNSPLRRNASASRVEPPLDSSSATSSSMIWRCRSRIPSPSHKRSCRKSISTDMACCSCFSSMPTHSRVRSSRCRELSSLHNPPLSCVCGADLRRQVQLNQIAVGVCEHGERHRSGHCRLPRGRDTLSRQSRELARDIGHLEGGKRSSLREHRFLKRPACRISRPD